MSVKFTRFSRCNNCIGRQPAHLLPGHLMLLLILGLHLVLGGIWLMYNNYGMAAIACFIAGMVCTHFGWKMMYRRNKEDAD